MRCLQNKCLVLSLSLFCYSPYFSCSILLYGIINSLLPQTDYKILPRVKVPLVVQSKIDQASRPRFFLGIVLAFEAFDQKSPQPKQT